ncbi:MAG: peptidoglycan DD-metalloendopeptidase family protein [Clostridia bacterium]|nr:peptidoglycan DD-metalloendopeptidase family protein [Clostridia bacterium]
MKRKCFTLREGKFAFLAAAVVLMISLYVLSSYYTLAYDVYYSGVKVGTVFSKAEAREAYYAAESEAGEEFSGDLRLCLRLAPTASINPGAMQTSLVIAATDMVECAAILSGDEKIVSLESEDEAKEAVALFAQAVSGEENSLVINYEIITSAAKKEDIKLPYEAAEKMAESGKITAVYMKTETEEKALPHEIIYINDETLPRGTTCVEQAGEDGYKITETMLCYNNDAVVQRLPETVIDEKAAVDEIIRIGTKNTAGLPDKISCPVAGYFTSGFGERWGRNHNGIDIAASEGTPVYAPCAGTVIFAGERSGYGNYVMIDHGNGDVTCYAHLSEIYVSESDGVSEGGLIGAVGTTGNVTGAHLHFEIMRGGSFVDPEPFIVM